MSPSDIIFVRNSTSLSGSVPVSMSTNQMTSAAFPKASKATAISFSVSLVFAGLYPGVSIKQIWVKPLYSSLKGTSTVMYGMISFKLNPKDSIKLWSILPKTSGFIEPRRPSRVNVETEVFSPAITNAGIAVTGLTPTDSLIFESLNNVFKNLDLPLEKPPETATICLLNSIGNLIISSKSAAIDCKSAWICASSERVSSFAANFLTKSSSTSFLNSCKCIAGFPSIGFAVKTAVITSNLVTRESFSFFKTSMSDICIS